MPRSGVQPEVERLLRENLALKAQVRALVLELKSERGARPKVSMRTRAAQVFAYLLTRGDAAFQNYYLSASRTTIERWATKLRRGPWPWRRKGKGGRPPLAQDLKDLIVKLKTENPLWGARRIKEELRRMGVKVSEPTIQKVLKEAGFSPRGGHPMNLEKWRSAAKDAIWALDFFFVRTGNRGHEGRQRASPVWYVLRRRCRRTPGLALESDASCARRRGRPGRVRGRRGRHVAARRGGPEGFLGPAGKGACGATGRVDARPPYAAVNQQRVRRRGWLPVLDRGSVLSVQPPVPPRLSGLRSR